MTYKMPPELKAKWVAALRSGDYEQGTSVLARFDGKYCCLGVLCEVMGVPKERQKLDYAYRYGGENRILPLDIAEQAGISPAGELNRPVTVVTGVPTDAEYLTSLNDWGLTFDQIADVIEEQF